MKALALDKVSSLYLKSGTQGIYPVIKPGDLIILGHGATVGVAITGTLEAGQEFSIALEGVYTLPKAQEQYAELGSIAYWDMENHLVYTNPPRDLPRMPIGFFYRDALGSEESCDVILEGHSFLRVARDLVYEDAGPSSYLGSSSSQTQTLPQITQTSTTTTPKDSVSKDEGEKEKEAERIPEGQSLMDELKEAQGSHKKTDPPKASTTQTPSKTATTSASKVLTLKKEDKEKGTKDK